MATVIGCHDTYLLNQSSHQTNYLIDLPDSFAMCPSSLNLYAALQLCTLITQTSLQPDAVWHDNPIIPLKGT